jgi:amino acid permease
MNYNPLRVDDQSSHASKTDSDATTIELSSSLSSAVTDPSSIKVNISNVESAMLNQATPSSIYVNLTSTLVGSGILGLSYGFSKAGYLLGMVLLVVCGFLSYMGLHLLYLCASKTELPSSFSAVAKISSLSYLSMLIDSAVFMKCLGVATSYPIIIGDLMPQAMRQIYGSSSADNNHVIFDRHFWIFISLLICAPLCFLRSLDSLKWTSTLSVIFIATISCLLFAYAVRLFGMNPCDVDRNAAECRYDQQAVIVDEGVLRSFPIFVFVFTCQHNTFAVVNELNSPTPGRVDRVFKGAIITTSIFYAVVAMSGYFTYGSNTASNVLISYPGFNPASISSLRIAILI